MKYADKKVYEGEFFENQKKGYGTLKYKNGKIYKGYFD